VDTTTSSLLEGKVIIFVDGAPYAIIAPTLFFDFFQAADDYHMKAGRFINRFIRYVSFLASIFLPAVYVTVDKYRSETFSKKTQELLFNKEEILPTFWEMAILLILFRILVDIGVRAPRGVIILITLIATTVIGQTSVEAKLIHPVGLVLVGLSVFLSFLIIYRGQTGLVFNLRYTFLLSGYYFGFSGMLVLATLVFIYLSQLKSLGVPYLSPLMPFRPTEFRDVFIRGDLRKLHNRKHIFPKGSDD
jgi:spore germination protein KA